MNKKVLVFDVDDTISIHKNRDYENAIPIQPVIDKLNKLHDEGYYIKLFTGRGQLSCNGNLNLILKTKKPILEKWLKQHNVKYDELIFGKPLGDWYIDDKGLNIQDFLNAPFEELKGGSNSSIYREFNKVIKKSKSSQAQNSWYAIAKKFNLNIPIIYSCVDETLYMEYVDGNQLTDCCTENDITYLVNLCYLFKDLSYNDIYANLDKYCDNLLAHLNNNDVNSVIKLLNEHKQELISKASFCHGDLTLSNIIKRDNKLVLIDPNYKNDYTSYLLDLAKIRQSLEDYEFIFNLSSVKNSKYRDYFDSLIKKDDLYLVKLLEITHFIRMYNYKSELERPLVLNMINKLLQEL